MNGLITYIKSLGISYDTIQAMRKIDRKIYATTDKHPKNVYGDYPISIGYDVTISQPSLVGKMIDFLQLTQCTKSVLEIGTGSAYNAAILSKLLPNGILTTVERVTPLANRAKKLLRPYNNIKVKSGDALNINYNKKFERIIVTAAFLDSKGVKQLQTLAAAKCICVFPLNDYLYRMSRCGKNEPWRREVLYPVRFVPILLGVQN